MLSLSSSVLFGASVPIDRDGEGSSGLSGVWRGEGLSSGLGVAVAPVGVCSGPPRVTLTNDGGLVGLLSIPF